MQKKDLETVRTQLREFFDGKPFPTKYLYYVTRLDFHKPDPSDNDEDEDEDAPKKTTEEEAGAAADPEGINNHISFYVAICGNGSVMVPMAVFPPVEEWHWERKKPVKLRHAHSLHRVKREDPSEALQFFAVVRCVSMCSSKTLARSITTNEGLVLLHRRGKSSTMRRPSTATSLLSFWTGTFRRSSHQSSPRASSS